MFGMIQEDDMDGAEADTLKQLFEQDINILNNDADYPDNIKLDLTKKLTFLRSYLSKALKSASLDDRRDVVRAFESAIWLGAYKTTKISKAPETLEFTRKKDLEQKRRMRSAEIINLPIKYRALTLWQKKPSRREDAQATATDIVDRVYEDLKLMPRRPKAWKKNLQSKRERGVAIKTIAARIRKLFP